MTGEFEEMNNTSREGDTFKFDLQMFRNSKDPNLQLLMNFFDELGSLRNSMVTINGITEEELEDENV